MLKTKLKSLAIMLISIILLSSFSFAVDAIPDYVDTDPGVDTDAELIITDDMDEIPIEELLQYLNQMMEDDMTAPPDEITQINGRTI